MLKIQNLGQPIVVDGQQGNFWKGIQVVNFSSVAINDSDSTDNFWQLRITGGPSGSAIGFQEAGNLNHIDLVCDFGQTASLSCLNDLGGGNMWETSDLTPVGTVASSSFLNQAGSPAANIPTNYQVSGLAITGTSPTITSPEPSCLEIGNSNGSGVTNYVTFLNGNMTVTTTKPSSCQ
jgi:hypothetical protein